MIERTIEVPIYGKEVFLQFGVPDGEMWGAEADATDDCEEADFRMRFRDRRPSAALVAHECFHLVEMLNEAIGAKGCSETNACLMQYLMEKVSDEIK